MIITIEECLEMGITPIPHEPTINRETLYQKGTICRRCDIEEKVCMSDIPHLIYVDNRTHIIYDYIVDSNKNYLLCVNLEVL